MSGSGVNSTMGIIQFDRHTLVIAVIFNDTIVQIFVRVCNFKTFLYRHQVYFDSLIFLTRGVSVYFTIILYYSHPIILNLVCASLLTSERTACTSYVFAFDIKIYNIYTSSAFCRILGTKQRLKAKIEKELPHKSKANIKVTSKKNRDVNI